jgi:hypothetical protein
MPYCSGGARLTRMLGMQGHMKTQAAARQRGDPSTQTSDARFDQSFQLASGLQRAADQVGLMPGKGWGS